MTAGFGPVTRHGRRPRTSSRHPVARLVGLTVVLAALSGLLLGWRWPSETGPTTTTGPDGWPSTGQAAIATGGSEPVASPDQAPVPIASVAKVMTAYVVLTVHPLEPDDDGPELEVDEEAVTDTDARRANDESVVAVRAGERLTERQALQAVLIPSANNIAVLLARWTAGSSDAFVERMNATAKMVLHD